METVRELLASSLAGLESAWKWLAPVVTTFIEFSVDTWYAGWFRIICLLVLVAATIWAIARIYGGTLQNAEKGPISIRRHKGTTGSVPLDTIVVPRDLIDLTMDGVHVHCTFMYVYEGHRQKRQHIPLLHRSMRLTVSPTKLSDKVLGIAKANEVPDVGSQEVY